MAYDFNALVLVQNSNAQNLAKLWTYTSSVDALATIEASGYFTFPTTTNPKTNDLTPLIAIGDGIWLYGTDGEAQVSVTGLAPITTSAVTNVSSLANGKIWIGSAGNVPVAQTLTGDVTVSNAGVTAIGAGKVGSAMISPLIGQYTSVTLTAAQFNGMYATPVQILAAPGSGKMITLALVTIVQDYVTTGFAGGGAILLQYGNTAHGAGTQASSTLAAATLNAASASTYYNLAGYGGAPISGAGNAAIYISNQTGAFTTGDSTFTINCHYTIIPST